MATVTAPSTPIEVCGRTGMNVRVPIVPPSHGALTRVVLGTDRLATSPRPISLPAASRSAWTRRATSSFPARCSADSAPVSPKSLARATTTGMPLSTQVTSTPSMTSRTLPVGSRLPVAEPAVPANPQQDRRAGARHARDGGVPRIAHAAPGGGECGGDHRRPS